MKNEEKNEDKKQVKEEAPKKRQIIIETNGSDIDIVKAEIAGSLELTAILESILRKINNK